MPSPVRSYTSPQHAAHQLWTDSFASGSYALSYDLLNDFDPIAMVSTGPFVLVAKKAMP